MGNALPWFLLEPNKRDAMLCSLLCNSSFPLLWSLTLVARTGCFCCCNTPVWSCQIPLNRTIYLITSQFEAFISYLHLFSLLPQTTHAPLSVRGMCTALSCTTLLPSCTLPLRPSKPTARSTVEMMKGLPHSHSWHIHSYMDLVWQQQQQQRKRKRTFPAM